MFVSLRCLLLFSLLCRLGAYDFLPFSYCNMLCLNVLIFNRGDKIGKDFWAIFREAVSGRVCKILPFCFPMCLGVFWVCSRNIVKLGCQSLVVIIFLVFLLGFLVVLLPGCVRLRC